MSGVIALDLNRELQHAFGCYQAGHLDEMEAACRRVLRVQPQQADAIHLMGLLSQQRGDLEQALTLIDRAIALRANESMHANRAMVLNGLRRHEEAVAASLMAIQANQAGAAAYGHLGAALQSLGRWEQAQTAYVQLLRLMPGHAPTLNCIGYGLLRQDRPDQALKVLEEACRLAPQLVDAQINLGIAMRGVGRFLESEACFRCALEIDPLRADAWFRLGAVLGDLNRAEEARAAFARSCELEPSPVRHLRRALILSHVYASRDAMLRERAQFEQELDQLLTAELAVPEPDAQLFSPAIFNLAYQGHDVLPTLRKLARLYLQMCPGLAFTAPHVGRPRAAGGTLRIGFFSAHVDDHPVSRCYAPMIRALAGDSGLEIYLISNRPLAQPPALNPYDGFTGTFVKVSHRVFEAREQIAALGLDVLVYQDIGMDDVSYFLAYGRLARRQCVLGGHPVTTGLPEMDIYVSSALGDTSDSQTHYSERLVLLDPGLAQFQKPSLPERFKSRAELGLPISGPLYVCPMMLQKLQPDFDAALADILQADPSGHVVLFGHPNAGWEVDLSARLDRSIPAQLRRRVLILPWVRDPHDFAAVNKHAAVVLDPFHFCIGSTAVTTFAVGTPLVTWPAAFLRGRVGLVYCRLLGIEECVARDQRHYVELAVRIANDAGLRARLSERIRANQHLFFDSSAHLASMRQFFASLREEIDPTPA